MRPVKFLVTWQLELALLSREMAAALARVPEYAAELERRGKIIARYHIVGAHGGVWIMDVDSHEELERLLGGIAGLQLLALRRQSALRHVGIEACSDGLTSIERPRRLTGTRGGRCQWCPLLTSRTANDTGSVPVG